MNRALLALLAAGILAASLAACGGSAKTTTSTGNDARAETTASTRSTSSTDTDKDSSGYLKNDGDKDEDDEPGYNKPLTESDGQRLLRAYGVKPSAAEMQAIATTVKRYFAAAAREQSAQACSLLAAGLAAGLSASAGGSGKACTNAMTTMLAQQHAQLLADEPATMAVPTARVKGELALAVLDFHKQPESQILLQREGKTWRIDALSSSELP
jgi:hypothetical protein